MLEKSSNDVPPPPLPSSCMDPESYPCNEDHFEVSDEPPSDEQLNVWANDTSYNYTCEKRVGEACVKVRESKEGVGWGGVGRTRCYLTWVVVCQVVHLLDQD